MTLIFNTIWSSANLEKKPNLKQNKKRIPFRPSIKKSTQRNNSGFMAVELGLSCRICMCTEQHSQRQELSEHTSQWETSNSIFQGKSQCSITQPFHYHVRAPKFLPVTLRPASMKQIPSIRNDNFYSCLWDPGALSCSPLTALGESPSEELVSVFCFHRTQFRNKMGPMGKKEMKATF